MISDSDSHTPHTSRIFPKKPWYFLLDQFTFSLATYTNLLPNYITSVDQTFSLGIIEV